MPATLASILGLGLLVLAMLFTLATSAMLGFYTGRVPQGANGMGLIVPLATGVLAALAMALAGLSWALRGGLDSLGWTRAQGAGAALGAALLVGLAIFGAFIAWAEARGARFAWLLNIGGLLLPLGAMALLALLELRGLQAVSQSGTGRVLLALGAGALLAGLVSALALGYAQALAQHQALARAREARQAEQAEQARRNAMSPAERLREELAAYSPDSPLWTLTSSLPAEPDALRRTIVVERALEVPHFEQDLRENLGSEHGIYRHGAVVLLAELPPERLQPAWAAWLAEDARRTADDIRTLGDLAMHGGDELGAHALAIGRVAARLPPSPALAAALARLHAAVAAAPAHALREPALQALQAAASRPLP
ncbi:hypothetical protein [Aquabacterium sp.]|uniref:hypothetical protein n=1 Tax=Aquabacterium sp. TaxID=1872578 RepID=UPI003783F859